MSSTYWRPSGLTHAQLQDQGIPDDIPASLSALRPPIMVNEDGVGMILVPDNVPRSLTPTECVSAKDDVVAQLETSRTSPNCLGDIFTF